MPLELNQDVFIFGLCLVAIATILIGFSPSSFGQKIEKSDHKDQKSSVDGEWSLLQRIVFTSDPYQSLSLSPALPTLFPLPAPDLNLTPSNLDKHKARDHLYANKCLRSPYFQTMAHQPMLSENWIELDGNYRRDLDFKAEVIRAQVSFQGF